MVTLLGGTLPFLTDYYKIIQQPKRFWKNKRTSWRKGFRRFFTRFPAFSNLSSDIADRVVEKNVKKSRSAPIGFLLIATGWYASGLGRSPTLLADFDGADGAKRLERRAEQISRSSRLSVFFEVAKSTRSPIARSSYFITARRGRFWSNYSRARCWARAPGPSEKIEPRKKRCQDSRWQRMGLRVLCSLCFSHLLASMLLLCLPQGEIRYPYLFSAPFFL